MLTRLGAWARDRAVESEPWTNVYGLGRSIVALATALTLVFNPTTTLFRPLAGNPLHYPLCVGARAATAFCVAGDDHLELARFLAIGALLLVASGWRPRITGLLHWWIAMSLHVSAAATDGGDQVAAVVTFLLLPVTLTDPRVWHWASYARPPEARIGAKLVALSSLGCVLRLQVAGIYFHASVAKYAVTEWADGTALYYWLTSGTFGAPPWMLPVLGPLLRWGPSVALMTWGVMVLEFFLATGLVMSRRHWGKLLVGGIALHAGIGFIQGIMSFSITMIGVLILYLRPPEETFDFAWLRAVRFPRLSRLRALAWPSSRVLPTSAR